MKEEKPEKTIFGQLLDASSVGIQLVLSTVVGLAMGYWFDRLFGTSPWLTFIFLIIGIISGFRELFRVSKRQEEKAEEADKVNDDGNNKPGL